MGAWIDVASVLLMVWLILVLVKKVRTKKGELELFLWVIVLAAHLVFVRFERAGIPEDMIMYALYGGFVLTLLLFNGRDVFRKDITKQKLKALKKDFEQLQDSSELLRQRFITMLGLLDDGVAFRSDDETMFGTKQYMNLMPFEDNEFSFQTFIEAMHSNDRTSYQETIKKLSKRKPTYEAHYRMEHDGETIWIKEKGTRLDVQKRTMYISMIKGLDVKRFPQSDVEVLNQLSIDKAFFEHIQALNHQRKPYTLVAFELSNIPAINDKYGREIGDLMMAEFVSKMTYHFLKDVHAVFRLTGIRFAMAITDHRKVEMLRRALEQGGDLVNYKMTFGNVSEHIYPSFGIHLVEVFDEPVDAISDRVNKALNIALDDSTPENYFIIR